MELVVLVETDGLFVFIPGAEQFGDFSEKEFVVFGKEVGGVEGGFPIDGVCLDFLFVDI